MKSSDMRNAISVPSPPSIAARVNTVVDTIRLRWEKTEETAVKVSGYIPANTGAELVLPDGSREKLGSGAFEFTAG